MSHKSDIESILESQTWKSLTHRQTKPKAFKRMSKVLTPICTMKEFEISTQDHSESGRILQLNKIIEGQSYSSCSPTDSKKQKSILAIPLLSFGERLNTVINDEDNIYVKIPVFPRSPFGKHIEMLSRTPTFELVHKESLVNSESVKHIKMESGRIKRSITSNLSSSIIKSTKKLNMNHGRTYGFKSQ